MKNRRLVLAVAVPFTAVALLGFCLAVAANASFFDDRPTVESSGSGGIGAVSANVAIPLLLALLFVAAAVFLNVALAPYARRQGQTAVRIRRAHIAAIVLTPISPFLMAFSLTWLSRLGQWDLFGVIAAYAALLNGAHAAFGVFAITWLRRG